MKSSPNSCDNLEFSSEGLLCTTEVKLKLTGNATHRKQPRQIQQLEKLSKWIKYSDRKLHLLNQPLKWPRFGVDEW